MSSPGGSGALRGTRGRLSRCADPEGVDQKRHPWVFRNGSTPSGLEGTNTLLPWVSRCSTHGYSNQSPPATAKTPENLPLKDETAHRFAAQPWPSALSIQRT
jgi:hypothetical protein